VQGNLKNDLVPFFHLLCDHCCIESSHYAVFIKTVK
jgi:hypothetical protein